MYAVAVRFFSSSLSKPVFFSASIQLMLFLFAAKRFCFLFTSLLISGLALTSFTVCVSDARTLNVNYNSELYIFALFVSLFYFYIVNCLSATALLRIVHLIFSCLCFYYNWFSFLSFDSLPFVSSQWFFSLLVAKLAREWLVFFNVLRFFLFLQCKNHIRFVLIYFMPRFAFSSALNSSNRFIHNLLSFSFFQVENQRKMI